VVNITCSFLEISKLSNSRISLNWSIDEVTTRNTTANFFGPLCSNRWFAVESRPFVSNSSCLNNYLEEIFDNVDNQSIVDFY